MHVHSAKIHTVHTCKFLQARAIKGHVPMLPKHYFFILILPLYPCSRNMINCFYPDPPYVPMLPKHDQLFLSWSSLCTHTPETWSIFLFRPSLCTCAPKTRSFFWILILHMHPCSSQQAKPKVKNWNQHPGKIKDRPSETTPWGEYPLTAVDFIRPISAVVVPVTDPRLGHTLVVLAAELPGLTRPQDALLLVRVVPAVIVQVTDVEGEGAVVILALKLAWRALLLRCSWHTNRMKINVRPGLLVHSGFIVLMNRKMTADSRDKKLKGLRVQGLSWSNISRQIILINLKLLERQFKSKHLNFHHHTQYNHYRCGIPVHWSAGSSICDLTGMKIHWNTNLFTTIN